MNDQPNPVPDIRSMSFSHSRQFVDWMIQEQVSIAFTSYQSGRLFLVGVDANRNLSMMQRAFTRAMGLYANDQFLYVADLYQLWRFDNVLKPGEMYNGDFDRLYLPRIGYTTGDVDIHDIGIDENNEPVFVNSLYSCLATVSDEASFKPLWKPPFISKLAAEDRCHMNGLAMKDGKPAFVTAISKSDAVEGWRARKNNGGIVVDVASGDVICDGLSMPHSPRLHDGKVWLLNSGTGWLGYVDPKTGKFEDVVFCPGFLRGLSFHGHFAIVGTSLPRNIGFVGLQLDGNLKARDTEPRCSVLIINTKTGDIVHWLNFESHITELYDVAFLPGVRRPMHLGFQSSEIRQMITMEGDLD
ncbi:MAG: TIGR03032 family protein [Rhizobiales bacterium]|nr:TIGR03032 family protein [Hyphomicrobiales bacterium]